MIRQLMTHTSHFIEVIAAVVFFPVLLIGWIMHDGTVITMHSRWGWGI